jgi:hypothetical protein
VCIPLEILKKKKEMSPALRGNFKRMKKRIQNEKKYR